MEEDKKAIVCLLSIYKVHLFHFLALLKKTISRIDGLPVHSGHSCPFYNVIGLIHELLKAHMRQHHKGVVYPLKDVKMDVQ